jgi:hypothetical protein
MAQVAEYLPSKLQSLSSNPSMPKKEKRKKEMIIAFVINIII